MNNLEWLYENDRDAILHAMTCSMRGCDGCAFERYREENRTTTCDGEEMNEWLLAEREVAELSAERDRLIAENKQLAGDCKGVRASRDHWLRVASRHAGEIQRLRRQLKAERELAGMWPRFEDGEPVRIGDDVAHYYDGRSVKIHAIDFDKNGFKLYMSNQFPALDRCPYGQAVKRPPILAKDGKPIEVGEVLYGEDCKAWTVEKFDRTRKHSVRARYPDNPEKHKYLKPEWLTHDKPDSFHRVRLDLNSLVRDKNADELISVAAGELQALIERIEKLEGGAR